MDFKTFLENFDAIAEAPGGIPKLRSLILDLAVRGKLVPQNSEDEPAFTEKKSVIEMDIGDLPELPKSWILSTVNNACSHIVDCPHSTAKFVDKGFYCIDTNSMSQGKILFEKARYVTEETFVQRTKRLLPEEGDILFSREGTIGLSAIVPTNIKLCLGQRMMMYRVHQFIDSFYFLYFLTSPFFKKQLELKITGTAAKHVNIGDIRKMVVIVPPLAEQKRIVEKVGELMGLCDRYEAAKQTRDNLRQKLRGSAIASLMNAETNEELDAAWAIVRDNWHNLNQHPEDVNGLRQVVIQLAVEGKLVSQDSADEPASFVVKRALEKRKTLTVAKKISKREPQLPLEEEEIPFELPSGWECIRFGEITDIVSGVTKGRKLSATETASYPYLRVANVQRWHLALEVMKEIEISVEELDKYRLQIGDVLLTEGGDWDKLGRSAIWQGEIEDCIHQNHVFRARPLDHGLLPEWAVIFTNSPVGRQYFESAAKRTTNLASINMTQLRFCPFPVPPEEEQKRIVAKVDELMQLCDQLEASLRQSQQRAESLAASAISHLTI